MMQQHHHCSLQHHGLLLHRIVAWAMIAFVTLMLIMHIHSVTFDLSGTLCNPVKKLDFIHVTMPHLFGFVVCLYTQAPLNLVPRDTHTHTHFRSHAGQRLGHCMGVVKIQLAFAAHKEVPHTLRVLTGASLFLPMLTPLQQQIYMGADTGSCAYHMHSKFHGVVR